MAASCPDDDAILGFVELTLPADTREAVAAHIDACPECRELLTDVAREVGASAGSPEDGVAPRYELVSPLGAGGMGIVHAAFDRELRRRVALKFLSSDPGEDQERARARLLREARALAQLAHPNVIGVHEVGVLDGEVFVAMELVLGANLRQWLTAAPRSVKDTLAVLRQAGEGLAAAHAAGIVHRDLKPENVLVGDDGRVRVSDFGLARAMDGAGEAPEEEIASEAAPAPALTRTGVHAGTPAYMAPEQKLGGAADARWDIYAYCVTVHEAVTGRRPGEASEPRRRPPRWLARVLSRGLRARPEERWPSMRALLDALARGPTITAARVALVLAVIGVGALAVGWSTRQGAACAPDASAWGDVWDASRRESVQAAFRAAAPNQADFAFEAVDEALARMQRRWIAMRADSCAATRVRHDQSEAVLDLRSACLDGARAKAKALVGVFEKADRGVVDVAATAVADLPDVDDCTNVRALQALDPLPEGAEARARIANAEAMLYEATALHHTGKEKEALDLIEPALAAVRSVGHPPLEAKLLVLRADVISELGWPAAQVDSAMHLAAQRSIEARDDASAAAAWILLTYQMAYRGGQGRVWAGYAESAISRVGGDDFLEANRSTRLGQIKLFTGNYDEARALFERAMPLFEKTRGPGYYRIGSILDGFGQIAQNEQRLKEALHFVRLGRDLRARAVGPENIATISSMFNEEEALLALGRIDEAEAVLREIDAICSRTPPPHRSYLDMAFGTLLRLKGQFAAALERDDVAIHEYEREYALDDSGVADALRGKGLNLLALHRPAEAIAPLERAAKLLSGDSVPLDHAATLFALAQALDGAGREPARAVAAAEEALALLEPRAQRYAGAYAQRLEPIEAWLRARGVARPR